MAEALEKVKKDLGKDAVILSTRTIRRGGVMGLGARTIVEITASRDASVLHPAERRAMSGARANGRNGANGETRTRSAAAHGANGRSVGGLTQRPFEPPAELTNTLRSEMEELRGLVRELLARPMVVTSAPGVAPAASDVPEELRDYYTTLIQNEVADEIAREVMAQARERLEGLKARAGANGRPAPALAQIIPTVLVESIERLLPPTEPVQTIPGQTKYVALVGPTGVGKTTTIAKLAAHFKLRESKRVGLITIDTYRIAAVDQLRAYADILGVPLEIALSPADIPQTLEKMSGCDLVLLDTSGRSQKDVHRLEELRQFLDAVRAAGTLETHLVLSCTAHPAQLLEVARRFSELGIDRVVFTKLDEAVGLGVILNVVRKLNLQLSYLTTGQDVPDDIEVGHRRRIAEMVLDRTGEWLNASGGESMAAGIEHVVQ